MSTQIDSKGDNGQTNPETFEEWRKNDGLRLPPYLGEDQETHTKRIAAKAWLASFWHNKNQ